MASITVALLQMTACPDQAAAQAKGEMFCRRAKAMGADIALFPEMWSNGYDLADEAWQVQTVDRNGSFVRHFCGLARELDMAIAITYLEQWSGETGDPSPLRLDRLPPRDTASLIDRHGAMTLTYAKVHTCDFDKEAALTPGDAFYVATLDTAAGPVRVGAMICFDREFPESARILMLQGAEIILVPNACDLEPNRIGQLRARAYENMVGVATANYAAGAAPDGRPGPQGGERPGRQGNGHSVAFDGIAFEGVDGASRDTLVVEAGEAEDVVWGNAYRRPSLYGLLTEAAVKEPFRRKDARR